MWNFMSLAKNDCEGWELTHMIYREKEVKVFGLGNLLVEVAI